METAKKPSAAPVKLREVVEDDLAIFFEQQLDAEANYMAAFTAKEPANRDSFNAHWARILADAGIHIRTILYRGKVAGYVLSHGWFGEPEISYWLGKEFWGKGIATLALAGFLKEQTVRPLYARAVKDNAASLRVLEKCGFRITGEGRGFANARSQEVEEYVLVLKEGQ